MSARPATPPTAPTQAMQEIKKTPPPMSPISDSTKPAVCIPPTKPAFFALLDKIKPTTPRITEAINDQPKNQQTIEMMPSTILAVAALLPGIF